MKTTRRRQQNDPCVASKRLRVCFQDASVLYVENVKHVAKSKRRCVFLLHMEAFRIFTRRACFPHAKLHQTTPPTEHTTSSTQRTHATTRKTHNDTSFTRVHWVHQLRHDLCTSVIGQEHLDTRIMWTRARSVCMRTMTKVDGLCYVNTSVIGPRY